ncbi:hypothetical protein M422DRAFT_67589 [Sphaerobolus stellatus SS14]|uniref:Alkyl transferase n=1 Tax=Sphaerobolus stellatus (strain SS14) TaxID=990650 RepID=A0A0C9UMV6_SPHS4|nr:hypothetical protein M422DRAFT_67589 [Sphaerobolus stellatus SS14]
MSSPTFSFEVFYNVILRWLERLLLAVLASGPMPKHIAFVMDGNRRYAGKKGKPAHEGHYAGFSSLRRNLDVCLRLGIRCVTVYAFAIDNFRRSPVEVETLMNMCEQKLHELCEHGDLLERYGVRLRVLGKTCLLPPNVQAAVNRAEKLTRRNRKATLNVMMPYASREEMTTAMQKVINKTSRGELSIDEISEDELDANMYTNLTRVEPVDILVRTSGVKRFSDFILWQISENVQVYFVDAYWPDFGLRHCIPILLDYQRKIWYQKLFLPQ